MNTKDFHLPTYNRDRDKLIALFSALYRLQLSNIDPLWSAIAIAERLNNFEEYRVSHLKW